MAKIKNSKDLIMLLLYARGASGKYCEPIEGQTRLMKMIFLFEKELFRTFNLGKIIDDSAFPKFEPYDYGPFSANVYSDLEFLVNLRFVDPIGGGEAQLEDEEASEFDHWTAVSGPDDDIDEQQVGGKFQLTELGKKFVQKLIQDKGITEQQLDVLHEFKKRCCEIPLRTLLKYVYQRYESMTTKSKIKDDVLG